MYAQHDTSQVKKKKAKKTLECCLLTSDHPFIEHTKTIKHMHLLILITIKLPKKEARKITSQEIIKDMKGLRSTLPFPETISHCRAPFPWDLFISLLSIHENLSNHLAQVRIRIVDCSSNTAASWETIGTVEKKNPNLGACFSTSVSAYELFALLAS